MTQFAASTSGAEEVAEIAAQAGAIVGLLNALEAQGIDQFGTAPVLAHAEDNVQALARSGVLEGRMRPTLPPRLLASGWGEGSLNPARVTEAVEGELEKPDNLRKLADAPAGAERHLFVWLHSSHWCRRQRDLGRASPPRHVSRGTRVMVME